MEVLRTFHQTCIVILYDVYIIFYSGINLAGHTNEISQGIFSVQLCVVFFLVWGEV